MRRRPWAVRRRPGAADTRNMVGTRASERWAGRATAALVALATVVAFAPAAVAAAPPELMEFPLAEGVSPFGIALGADGAMWFTERGTDSVGRIEVDGSVGAYDAARGSAPIRRPSRPEATARSGSPSRVSNRIGRHRSGRRPRPSSRCRPANAAVAGITAGPDGAMWFTERSGAPDRPRRRRRHRSRSSRCRRSCRSARHRDRARRRALVHRAARQPHRPHHDRRRRQRSGRCRSPTACRPASPPVPTARCGSRCERPTASGASRTAGEIRRGRCRRRRRTPPRSPTGWDGAMWFTGPDTDLIGRVALDGTITEFPLPHGRRLAVLDRGRAGRRGVVHRGQRERDRPARRADAPADTTPPTVAIDAPVDGRVVTSSAGHVGGLPLRGRRAGPGLATCVGTVADGAPVDATPGAHRFDVTATDGAGQRDDGVDVLRVVRLGRWLDRLGRARGPGSGPRSSSASASGRRRSASDVVAPGFPVTPAGRLRRSDRRRSARRRRPTCGSRRRQDGCSCARWRTKRSMAGTCRAITFRFVADRAGAAPTRRSWSRSSDRDARVLQASPSWTRGGQSAVEQAVERAARQLVAVEAAVVPRVHAPDRQLGQPARATPRPLRGRRTAAARRRRRCRR